VRVNKTSLSERIDEYLANRYSQFHSPAHCGYLNPRDLSEVEGLDDLQNPETVLKDLQEEIAQFFGARESFILTNGASQGLQASCLALRLYLEESRDSRRILLARNVHKSVIAGVILAGLDIEWFEPVWDEDLGAYTRIETDVFTTKPIENYAALIITNPSYEGFYSDLMSLQDLMKAHNTLLIIDEAHGAHYHFSDRLPQPALKYGADLIVQSWHKTLGSLTQTGILHSGINSRIPTKFIKAALSLLQTTSPSYLLLESISKVFYKYQQEGTSIIDNLVSRAADLQEYRIHSNDPTRYLIKVPGYTGEELYDYLLKDKISVEEVLENAVLASINPGNSNEDIEKINLALQKIKARTVSKDTKSSAPKLLTQKKKPRDAFFQDQDISIIAPCPPGIAERIPGQC
jgi:arginine/lysine/ornithine decarboxylase